MFDIKIKNIKFNVKIGKTLASIKPFWESRQQCKHAHYVYQNKNFVLKPMFEWDNNVLTCNHCRKEVTCDKTSDKVEKEAIRIIKANFPTEMKVLEIFPYVMKTSGNIKLLVYA